MKKAGGIRGTISIAETIWKRGNQSMPTMSPKELLYIEDALGHAKEMQTACTDFASQLQDPELKTFAAELSNKLQDCFSKFYGLL